MWITGNGAQNQTEIKIKSWFRQGNDGARAAVWQHVFTAEHKMKKPRPLSHTPLGPKLYGVLHSTHKQPPGNVWKRQGDAGRAGEKQQLPFHISTMREAAEARDGDLDFTLTAWTEPKTEIRFFFFFKCKEDLVTLIDVPLIFSNHPSLA